MSGVETTPSVLFVAAFDSQLKWCGLIRDALVAQGFAWRVVVPEGRSALSAEQVLTSGFDEVTTVSWPDLVSAAIASDVVVSALSGPRTQALTVDLASALGERRGPVVVCGWVGVIIEKITAGYLDRCGADVVAVNSVQDLEHFRTVADRLQLDSGNLLLSGLPLLGPTAAAPRSGPVRRVVFADQPTVPGPADERAYVYQRLVDYARAHPEREVLLKPRHRPGEDTFHRMLHHPERLLAATTAGCELPPNFRIDYTSISDLLPHTDLLLTVSSTAALEALDHGCRVGLVLDLGVHERLGNHVFLDSGLLRTFDQITADDLGAPDPDWYDGYFFPRPGSAAAVIAARVVELLASDERPGRRVRDSAYFASALEFHARVVSRRRGRPYRSPARIRATRIARAVLPERLVEPARRIAAQVGARR